MGKESRKSVSLSPTTARPAASKQPPVSPNPPKRPAEPDWSDSDEDFDRIYDEEESTLGDISKRPDNGILRSIVGRMLHGDGIGQLLPIWVFERRSLLEVYSGFFSHPSDFVAVADAKTPEERFLAAVRFYLGSIFGLKKHEIARKPYNPLLGETFRCRWALPNAKPTGEKTTGGPFPGTSTNHVAYMAEQVSHHPPVSAFYAECPAKRISYNGSIWTKVAIMQYIPPSIGATHKGEGVLKLHDLDEEYVMDFPSAYGRDILSKPWVEFGGKVKIKCKKTGYKAEIYFRTHSSSSIFFKSSTEGKKHRIEGLIYKNKSKILKLRGEWTGVVIAERFTNDKGGPGTETEFADAKAKSPVRKECDPVNEQGQMESRRVWRHVTAALYHNDYDKAKKAKEWLSESQREKTAERNEKKEKWIPKHFIRGQDDVDWKYANNLGARSIP